jgi:predicted small integral membrane protein
MKNFQNKANIVRVSKIIRSLLFAGLVVWILAIPTALFAIIPQWNLRPASRYVQCEPLLVVFCFIINLKLFRFFDRLKNGNLFDAQTVGNLDAAGRWWVALWFFENLFYAIGHEFFQMANTRGWNALGDGSNLFAGLTLIFVAWLLKEAQELQQEQELTV